MDRRPAKGDDGTTEDERGTDVQRADRIGEKIRNQTSKYRPCIEESQHIEAQILACDSFLDTEGGDIVEWDIHSHKSEKGSDSEKVVGQGA